MLRLWVIVGITLLVGAGWLHAEEAKDIKLEITDDWRMEKIFKSAKLNKHHFLQGVVGVKNISSEKLTHVRARVSIIANDGKTIDSSKSVPLKNIAPGKKSKGKFIIDLGVQFAEVVVVVTYDGADGRESIEFANTPHGGKPVYTPEGGEDGVMELLLLSADIERTGIGKRGKNTTYTAICRVRNASTATAINPTLKVFFRVSKAAKKKSRRKSRKKRRKKKKGSNEPAALTVVGDKIEILLAKSVSPGETKVFKNIALKNVPEYDDVQFVLSTEWNQGAVADGMDDGSETQESNAALVAKAEADPQKLYLGDLRREVTENGTDLVIAVANAGADIPKGSLKLTIILQDANDKKLLTINHSCEAVLQGSVAQVRITGKKIPAYMGYQTSIQTDTVAVKP